MNRSFPCLLAAATLTLPAPAIPGELDVTANTPAVSISTRPAGRNFIRLPDLDFVFVVDARCPAELQPGSVSISIADTRVALDASEASAPMPLSVPVSVPASQIGPIPAERFCSAADDPAGSRAGSTLTVPAVLSAQVSLFCAGESGSEMTYASRSLDVTLHCETPGDPDAATPSE